MSQGSRHRLSYIAETTRGTTPATPVFQEISHKGSSLALKMNPINADKVRSDRQMVFYRMGTQDVQGDIDTGGLTYGEYDDFFEAALGGTWATNVLKAGTTRRSFSIEDFYADQSTGNPYQTATGVEITGFDLTASINNPVEVTFHCLGQDVSLDSSIITGATYTPSTATELMIGFNGAIKEGGATIATITEIQAKLDNGVKSRFTVGSTTGTTQSIGMSNLTGQVSLYFDDSTVKEEFINRGTSSLEFEFLDASGNSYDFLVPKIIYSEADSPTSGEGDIILTMKFQAVLDSSSSTNLQITRTP